MYWAVILFLLDYYINVEDQEWVKVVLQEINICFVENNYMFFNGRDVEREIWQMFVFNYVSEVVVVLEVCWVMVSQ